MPIDLCSLDDVKAWLGIATGDVENDESLELIITAVSTFWLWATGRADASGNIPDDSPFVNPVVYDEWYDGNGNDRLFVRNNPVLSVSLLQVNGMDIPASVGFTSLGYVVDGAGKSIVLRGGGGSRHQYGRGSRTSSRYCFSPGTQNIEIMYTAGYTSTPLDIQDAVIKTVAYWFSQKKHIGFLTQDLAGTLGIIRYAQTDLPPGVQMVIDNYSRIPQP